MAATRGYVTGHHANSSTGTATRLGHRSITARADTWQTYSTVRMNADGSGYVTVTRNGKTIVSQTWGPENEG